MNIIEVLRSSGESLSGNFRKFSNIISTLLKVEHLQTQFSKNIASVGANALLEDLFNVLKILVRGNMTK